MIFDKKCFIVYGYNAVLEKRNKHMHVHYIYILSHSMNFLIKILYCKQTRKGFSLEEPLTSFLNICAL